MKRTKKKNETKTVSFFFQ